MNVIERLERRFHGRGIPNLMKIIIIINILGAVINFVNPKIYMQYLSLDIAMVLQGQVWRLITFILNPMYNIGMSAQGMMDLLWFALWIFVYYSIGNALERVWGGFRFTLFMITGWLLIILVAFGGYFVLANEYTGADLSLLSFYQSLSISMEYLYQSMFLAFALMFPDMQFLLYFVIPVKAKWLAIVYALMDIYMIYQGIRMGNMVVVGLVVAALLNVIFFIFVVKGKSTSTSYQVKYKTKKRKQRSMGRTARESSATSGVIHRCAICGKTEQDAPGMMFRYCSKCEGAYEYCSEHLFTHEHVKK